MARGESVGLLDNLKAKDHPGHRREAAGKAIEDRKILKEKADAQEKRIAELETLLDGYFLAKEENRKFRETICKMAAVIYG